MDSVEIAELAQRSVSVPGAIPETHEPDVPYLGVLGLVPPQPVIVDEE
ncbi:hypothetical protein [Nocardia africana]